MDQDPTAKGVEGFKVESLGSMMKQLLFIEGQTFYNDGKKVE